MNPLQEKPHLFANGKFRVMHDSEGIAYPIVSVRPSEDWDWFIHTSLKAWDSANAFTLIARPIADMTDEEIREICNYKWDSDQCQRMRKHLIQLANDGTLPLSTAMQISNRGVYPLDQKAFQDGTVLDSTETEPGRN